MADTGEGSTRSPRFIQWASFLIFSTITLGSVVEVVNDNKAANASYSRSNERWSIACSAITFSITAIVVLMHLHPTTSIFVVGTKFEGFLCLLLAAFWIATVSIITDSRYGLAVDEKGAVKNGNLYYFSWAGFVCSILLVISYLRHVFGVDVAGEIRTRSARLTIWSGHLACSLVVMGTSANFYDNTCGPGSDGGICGRAVYGIVLGAVGTLFAVAVVAMKVATTKAPFLVEVGLSFLLVLMYCVGVALITSADGPGAPLGNLYYFTWLGFLTSFMMIASCYEDFNAAKAVNSQEVENANASEAEA